MKIEKDGTLTMSQYDLADFTFDPSDPSNLTFMQQVAAYFAAKCNTTVRFRWINGNSDLQPPIVYNRQDLISLGQDLM